ncbi:MAG TPA: sigma-70 family RNA polymerase sigma factor [Baekduia sp.]|uniref:sigma-70 family RNA polymerase sigma factor n=1 Tax=Baekduia sp. TaxID=2600305 RepID=UPI002D7A3674|nr:sigma-70 family RNA polymerase sigma factor [Baekduia sp.]HET6508027.1 sigma-70 family RNA polymerase sigma factor [Baekduia sp.]
MAALPSTATVYRRRRRLLTDHDLVTAVRAGDEDAFALICERYEPRLVGFAARVLGPERSAAEDVVQDALLRTHRTLLRDDRPMALRAWLYRVVRNGCLDELSRGRRELASLDDLQPAAEPAAPGPGPAELISTREQARDVLGDLAALPAAQRAAILGRELEGRSHEDVARELGVSVQASRNLVFRARENLVRTAEARAASCLDVRDDLLRAHDARRRASARTYRHLAGCAACRAYRAELQRIRGALHLLAPAPVLLAAALTFKAIMSSAGGGSAAKTVTVVAAGAALTGGAIELAPHVLRTGDPAPVALRSPVLPGGALAVGAPLPARTALVLRDVRLPEDAPRVARRVALDCPAGMAVAGVVPGRGGPARGLDPDTPPGTSRRATIVLAASPRPAGGIVHLGVVCRVPDARGSLLAGPAAAFTAAAPTRLRHVCRARIYLRSAPKGPTVGSVFRGQPLALQRRRDGWVAVRTDAGARGWLPAAGVC